MVRPTVLPERSSLNVYLTADQKARLQKYARKLRMSPSAVIRQWIDAKLPQPYRKGDTVIINGEICTVIKA